MRPAGHAHCRIKLESVPEEDGGLDVRRATAFSAAAQTALPRSADHMEAGFKTGGWLDLP